MQISRTIAIVAAASACAPTRTSVEPEPEPPRAASSSADAAPTKPAVASPVEPPPPTIDEPRTPPDATYSHAGSTVNARLLAGEKAVDPDAEVVKTLEIRFVPRVGPEVKAALKRGTVSGCGNTEVHIEGVPELRDERLAMLNLFCENGEDVFSREIVTALLFVGDDGVAPAVLWEGEGSYGNDFDACIRIDVPFFRRTKRGAIQAMRETEVERNAGGDIPPEPECIAEKRRVAVLATIAIPGS